MRKIIGTITIAMLLMTPFLLMIPVQVIAQPTMKLSDAVGGGTGGTFYLNPSILYTGGVTISGNTWIYGNGAMIDLQWSNIVVTGKYLYIERCTITNGTGAMGAIEFLDGASGFVYNNIIVGNNDDGIYIKDSSNIIIKENSIIHNFWYGIEFYDSTDITILENIIANNDVEPIEKPGIYGGNGFLYEEDPNALHNINIKANKIFENGGPGIALEFVNGVSISSNLIHSNSGDGILLISCPIVSITHNKILANEDGGITYFGDPDWPIVLVDTTEVEVELSLTISYNKIMGNGLDIGELIEGIISLLPFLSLEAGSPEETMLFNEVDPFMMKFGAGIFVAFAQNVVVTYNEIEGNSGVGLCLLGGFIMPGSASVAYSNFDEEVFLMEPVLVAYNTISGNTMAALMIGVSDVKILFNNIEGNIAGVLILGAGIFGNPIEGIQSEDILIKGNVLKDQLFALILIAFDAPVTIEWNTVTNNMVGIVLFDCESPQIIHNTIMYQRGFKLDLGALGIPFLLDLRYALTLGLAIDDTVISGYCDGARIAYNTIAYNVGHQVGIFDSYDVVVEHNTIIGGSVDGILAQESLDLTVQYNKITDNDQGIRWIDCSGLISNNIIGYSGSLSGNNVGINLTSIDDFSPVTISDNVIIGNNVSIFLINEDPTIVRNYIANNVYGIYLTSTSSPTIGGTPDNRNYIIRNYADGVYIADDASDPVINYNNIYWNIGFGINNWAATTDDNAEYNWWGEMDGPGGIGPGTGDEVTSGLDYIPWLTAPIP